MLRQRHRVEDEPSVDADDPRGDDYRELADDDVGDHRDQVPDDPRLIRDDGTLVSDADGLTWAQPPNVVSASAEPAAAAVPTARRFSFGQVLILLAGGASLVFGFGAVALAGLAGPVTEPVVQAFGLDHTPLLGLTEIAAGTVLVLAALAPGGRWVAGPVGVAAIVGGALVLAELDWPRTELAAEQRYGWVPIAIGAVAFLGAMMPTKRRETSTAKR